jgi:hypothetical protein
MYLRLQDIIYSITTFLVHVLCIKTDGKQRMLISLNKNGFLGNISVADTLHNDWQLYNLNEDFNERNDLAKKYPEKVKELKHCLMNWLQKIISIL